MSVDDQSRIKRDIDKLVDIWERMASDDDLAIRLRTDPEALWRDEEISQGTINVLMRGDLKEIRQRFTFPGEERVRIVFLVIWM